MKKITTRFIQFFFLIFLFLVKNVHATEIWYEDNNGGGSEQGFFIKKGFVTKFNNLDSFKNALKQINVYMVSAPLLMQKPVTDQFLTEIFYPLLKKNNIKLALDAPGAMFLQNGGKAGDNKPFERDITQLTRLKKLGIEVSYVSLQSVLSKPLVIDGQRFNYSIDDRIKDIVDYSIAVKKIYPNIKIGLIDAMFTHGESYTQPFKRTQEALHQNGISLSYIHLDIPSEIPIENKNHITWDKIKEFENFVEQSLNIDFGMLAVTKQGGNTSNQMFHEGVMSSLECYATVGGTPSSYILMAWFPYPNKVVPDNAIGDDYPAMRTVREFGHELKNNPVLSKIQWLDKCSKH